MRLKLPKPMHGWRAFAGEVGIIVLGVLIALAADQLVDDWRSRRELEEFREALAKEAAYDLGAYEYRLGQSKCVVKRLAELDQWHSLWRNGRAPRLSGPIGRPTNLSLLTSVWSARTNEVVAEMPLSERLAYSRFYDSLRTFDDVARGEREVWRELAEYEAATRLDDAQQMRLYGLISRAKSLNQVSRLNTEVIMKLADPLNVRPTHDPDEIPPLYDLCKCVLGPPAT